MDNSCGYAASLTRIRADSDHAHHAASGRAFFSITEEEIISAAGAERAHGNILGRNSGVDELPAIGGAQIEPYPLARRLVAGRHHGEPWKRVGLLARSEALERTFEPFRGAGELPRERLRHFGSDFVATGTYGRAQRGKQIFRFRPKLEAHSADSFCDDPCECAAPSRMDGGHNSPPGVGHQDGHTISSLDPEEQTGPVTNGSIARQRSWRSCSNDVHNI
jgi:hypothetical protein